ncbi:MAG: Na+/H+ antiporter NhaA [Legionellaceae bacterium]|nr:Na+/H+ antiporter NhaA [Legionellaceae bacterium]
MNRNVSFFNLETIGGILLFCFALIAIFLANSPFQAEYTRLLNLPADVSIGTYTINKPLVLWINDGLMAIYFMMVGLEIKREIKRGVLRDKTSVVVPAITALCGLMVPAAIYYAFNYGNPLYIKGWAIPTATDIAFSLGILSLLGSRVPLSLKILLTAIAIFDDMAAIIIIAIYYTQKLSLLSLLSAGGFTIVLALFNYFKVQRVSLFIFIGTALWIAVLQSGMHATLAGIIIAMSIPDDAKHNHSGSSMLTRLEDGLHPWVVFFILPMFALANAGVSFAGMNWELLMYPVVLGTALGLFVGKQVGIFLPLWYFVKRRRYLPADDIKLKQVYGLALVCGVGFTMSLFIGSLAFQRGDLQLMNMVKIGVLIGSLCSGLLGYLVLRASLPKRPQ